MSCFNGENYLPATLESIRHQTFKDFEFLIFDDGSQDRSLELLQKAAEADSRIHIFSEPTNQGLSMRLAQLAAKATGRFIARQDVGDRSRKNRLQNQLTYLEQNSNVAVVGSAFDVFDDVGWLYRAWEPNNPTYLREKLQEKNYFAHGSLMFRGDTFRAVKGYDPHFRYAQDYDLLLRMAQWGNLAYLSNPLYRYRLDPQGLSIRKASEQSTWAQRARERLGARPQPPDLNAEPPTETWYRQGYLRGGHWLCLLGVDRRSMGIGAFLDRVLARWILGPLTGLFERLYKKILATDLIRRTN